MRVQGIVTSFDERRGFGFIVCGDREVFVHFTQIRGTQAFKTLEPCDIVEFDLYLDPNNPNRYIAMNVTKVSP